MSNASIQGRGASGLPTPAASVPMHWIDTTPVESSDEPCSIESLALDVKVKGLYADVTETLVVHNPNRRDISASLEIFMPDRAAVCGYALDIDGQMIDGVAVPKDKARVVFETEQRIGADPGLVESVKGNVYRTRIYPVPGYGTRAVRLRYAVPLLLVGGDEALLDVPMPAEQVGKRTLRVQVELPGAAMPTITGSGGVVLEDAGSFWLAQAEERDVSAGEGLRVALPQLPESFAIVERDAEGGLWFSASERVAADTPKDIAELDSLTVLWDVSGSRAGIDHAPEIELLRGYCEGATKMRLVAFGDQADDPVEFASADELVEHVEALRYDGATDFEGLSRVLSDIDSAGVCVLFTDGMGTSGNAPMSLARGCKVVAIVSGATRDHEYLRQACGGLVFNLVSAPRGGSALAQAACYPNRLTGFSGEGVSDVVGIGSGADGRYSVVGRLGVAATTISFDNTGTEFQLAAVDAHDGSTLSSAWAAARVAQLSSRPDENSDELLDLGRRFGVVSPVVSLLVLETLDQWLRYELEPPASWHQMHDAWERHIGGMMKHSSEEGLRNDHLRDLRSAWARLLEWWERDFSDAFPGAGSGFCPVCGTAVPQDARFCPNCGSPMDFDRRRLILGASEALPSMGGTGEFALDDMEACSDDAPVMFACESMPMQAGDLAAPCAPETGKNGEASVAMSVSVQPWMPDAEYLKALDEGWRSGLQGAHDAYFAVRGEHAASPSFYIDCAGWFLAHDDATFGLRVLSNLAEMRIEDAAMLRVMAWRQREAGELERALGVLRRVLKLRPEDSQSHRDVALVLDELARRSYDGGDEEAARAFAEEAGEHYRLIALTPWQRRAQAAALFAVEEYNVLRAWSDVRDWDKPPALEPIAEGLEGVLACDLRVTLAWDADETDIDLHVTEPGGEEAYYAHPLTHAGGRVSEDITDGYGPELYEIRKGEEGDYVIRAHYYASHQQSVFGPASCTLTAYTDWGRPTQRQTVTSVRLENEKEMTFVGVASYGDAAAKHEAGEASADRTFRQVRVSKGSSASELVSAYGEPAEGDPEALDGQLLWKLSDGRVRIATIAGGKLERLVEQMSWGEEMVITQ